MEKEPRYLTEDDILCLEDNGWEEEETETGKGRKEMMLLGVTLTVFGFALGCILSRKILESFSSVEIPGFLV